MNKENLSRNARRRTGSGLAGVRPYAVDLGPTNQSRVDAQTEEVRKPYSALDQFLAMSRMVITEPAPRPLNPAKNGWTGH